jgi:hypothetical protein
MLRYRLRTATVAVHKESTRPVAITIPAGTILKGFDGLANTSGFVEVEWDGERVQIFAVDLRDRGEIIRRAS